MTPQQVRIFSLQASRKWGPFTEEEAAHLERYFKPRKSRPEDVERPNFSDVIRVLVVPETLDNLRTRPMPGE